MWAFLAGLAFAQNGAPKPFEILPVARDTHVPEPDRGGGTVLFSTFSGIAADPFAIPSQRITDSGPNFLEIAAADDFEVPAAVDGWRLREIRVVGVYDSGEGVPAGPAESVNIFILANDGGSNFPDTNDLNNALFVGRQLPFADLGNADFQVTLPDGGVVLDPGTYWLAVQADQAVATNGQWFWTESSLTPDTGQTHGEESVWIQNAALVGADCIDAWGRRISDCGITRDGDPGPFERDLAFELRGEEVVNIQVTSAPTLQVSEDGTEASFAVVLGRQPSDVVTLTAALDDDTEADFANTRSIDIMFDENNWDLVQNMTIQGLDDDIVDGNINFNTTLTVASNDDHFDGYMLDAIDGINLDNECGITQITDRVPFDSRAPDLDGGGNQIVFQSDGDFVGQNPEGRQEIFVFDRILRQFTQITDATSGGSFDPTMSDDGNRIAFHSNGNVGARGGGSENEVYLYDVGGDQFTQITTSEAAGRESLAADISGDGQFVAFLSNNDPLGQNPDHSYEAFLYDVVGDTLFQMSDDAGDDPAADVVALACNGDGSRIAYCKTNFGLFLVDRVAVTTELIDAAVATQVAINGPGDALAYIADGDPTGENPDGNEEIFYFEGDTMVSGTFGQITQTNVNHLTGSSVALSSNGNRIGFYSTHDFLASNPDGSGEVFVFRRDLGTFLQVGESPLGSGFSGLALADTSAHLAFGNDRGINHEIFFASQEQDVAKLVPLWPGLSVLELLVPKCEPQ